MIGLGLWIGSDFVNTLAHFANALVERCTLFGWKTYLVLQAIGHVLGTVFQVSTQW